MKHSQTPSPFGGTKKPKYILKLVKTGVLLSYVYEKNKGEQKEHEKNKKHEHTLYFEVFTLHEKEKKLRAPLGTQSLQKRIHRIHTTKEKTSP